MSGKRIVEETPCEHGHVREHSIANPDAMCPGGSRRVLTEGQYVLIEKVGDQPENWRIIDPAGLLAPIVDALSDHTEGTP